LEESRGVPKRVVGAAAEPQDEGRASVVAFLQEAGLRQYAETLFRNGFDDMETLLEIDDADMKELGISASNITVLSSRLQELRRHTGRDIDPNNPVVRFLTEAGLVQYAETLLLNGFDDMETLHEIQDSDIREFGLSRGHGLKLLKRLRERPLQCHEALPTILQTRPLLTPSPQAVTHKVCRPASIAQGRRPNVTDQMKGAVEASWEQVQVLGSYRVGELLYKHTFELAPEAVNLFPIEVRHKYRDWGADEAADESDVYESPALRKLFGKVVNAVGCAVAGLSDLGRLVPMLTHLGARHVNYGVSEIHFPILGKALTITLRECLGEAFTPEVEHAWTTVYGFITAIMIEGLRAAQKDKSRKQGSDPATIAGSELSRDDDSISQASAEREWSTHFVKNADAEPEAARVDVLACDARHSALATGCTALTTSWCD
jgi:hypothetical protein